MEKVLEPRRGRLLADRPELHLELVADTSWLGASYGTLASGGPVPPAHVHHEHADCFLVLEGGLRLVLASGEQTVKGGGVGAGTCRRRPHVRTGGAGADAQRPRACVRLQRLHPAAGERYRAGGRLPGTGGVRSARSARGRWCRPATAVAVHLGGVSGVGVETAAKVPAWPAPEREAA